MTGKTRSLCIGGFLCPSITYRQVGCQEEVLCQEDKDQTWCPASCPGSGMPTCCGAVCAWRWAWALVGGLLHQHRVVLWPSRVSSCRVCARRQQHRDPRSRSAPQDRYLRRVVSPLLLCLQEQQLHLVFLRFLPELQINEQFLKVWLINSSWLRERGSLAYFQLTLVLADLRVNSETRKLT